MKTRSIRSHAARQPLCSLRALALVPACLALGACTSEELSLGAGDEPTSDEPSCAYGEDGIVEGDVLAGTQVEIDALAGCEEVRGNLIIYGTTPYDVRSLSSLRVVRGALSIGGGPEFSARQFDDFALLPSIEGHDLADIESLEGLESLEEVGLLRIQYLQSADLLPLSHLTRVQGAQWLGAVLQSSGLIAILDSPNLVDLSGLEGLREWRSLNLSYMAALTSLNGLGMPYPRLTSVSIDAAPAFRDLSGLAPILTLGLLSLVNTGVESLGSLSLQVLDSLTLQENPNLVEFDDAFLQAQVVGRWGIISNPKLDHLPEGPVFGRIESLKVIGNAELRSIPLHTQIGVTYGLGLGTDVGNPDVHVVSADSFDIVEIARNPKLTQLDLPPTFRQGTYVGIYENASLTELALGSLLGVDMLAIRDNPVLSSVGLGDLETAEHLAIQNNPALSVAGFSEVKTFDSSISGNADAPASATAP